MSGSTQIVHEAETQRQHVRLQLPIEVEIGDTVYNADDWSHSGIALHWPDDSLGSGNSTVSIGQHLQGTLRFPFPEFGLTVPIDLEVRNINADNRRVGCRFTNLGERQTSLLQYLVSAYISGEVVSAGDFIDVVGRNNQTTARSLPKRDEGESAFEQTKRKLRRVIGLGATLMVFLLLLGYVITGIYERSYVTRASSASVMTESITVEAPVAGKLFYQPLKPGTKVKTGDPLLMVETDKGNMVSVDSPCNCIVRERLEDNYARTSTAKPAIKMLSVDAEPYITAYVPFDKAVSLARGQEALLSFHGYDRYVKGRISSIDAGNEAKNLTLVIIEPDESLPKSLIGEPVEVTFDTFRLFAGSGDAPTQ